MNRIKGLTLGIPLYIIVQSQNFFGLYMNERVISRDLLYP